MGGGGGNPVPFGVDYGWRRRRFRFHTGSKGTMTRTLQRLVLVAAFAAFFYGFFLHEAAAGWVCVSSGGTTGTDPSDPRAACTQAYRNMQSDDMGLVNQLETPPNYGNMCAGGNTVSGTIYYVRNSKYPINGAYCNYYFAAKQQISCETGQYEHNGTCNDYCVREFGGVLVRNGSRVDTRYCLAATVSTPSEPGMNQPCWYYPSSKRGNGTDSLGYYEEWVGAFKPRDICTEVSASECLGTCPQVTDPNASTGSGGSTGTGSGTGTGGETPTAPPPVLAAVSPDYCQQFPQTTACSTFSLRTDGSKECAVVSTGIPQAVYVFDQNNPTPPAMKCYPYLPSNYPTTYLSISGSQLDYKNAAQTPQAYYDAINSARGSPPSPMVARQATTTSPDIICLPSNIRSYADVLVGYPTSYVKVNSQNYGLRYEGNGLPCAGNNTGETPGGTDSGSGNSSAIVGALALTNDRLAAIDGRVAAGTDVIQGRLDGLKGEVVRVGTAVDGMAAKVGEMTTAVKGLAGSSADGNVDGLSHGEPQAVPEPTTTLADVMARPTSSPWHGFMRAFMPSGAPAGASWQWTLDFRPILAEPLPLSVDPSYVAFARLIVLASALLYAFRIVFGGA